MILVKSILKQNGLPWKQLKSKNNIFYFSDNQEVETKSQKV